MLEGTDFYFQLTISVYENCVSGYNQCTVSSRIRANNAFVAGYTSIYNELDGPGYSYNAYEIFEFGYESLILDNPETSETVPDFSRGVGGSQSSTETTTDTGPGRRSSDSFLAGSTDWRVGLDTNADFFFSAIQYRITARIGSSTTSERDKTSQVLGYTISDIFLEKAALDSDTTKLVDYSKQGSRLDADIKLGFCDRLGVCTDKITIELRGSSVTSLLSYLEDDPRSENRMIKTEIFSLSSDGFRIIINV